MRHNYLLLLLTFRPRFPPSFFLFSSERDIHQHLFVTGFVKIETLSLRWLTWSELHSQSLFSELLSKRLSSRSCLKFRRGNDDRNWIYLFATEVTFDANLFVSPFRDTLAKNVRACHTRWRNLCLRNSIFVYFDGTNPITGEGIHLRSSTPIMALGIISLYHEGKELFELVRTQVMLINSQFYSAPCDIARIPIKVKN